MPDLAELQEAVEDARRIVKSLSRHARTATQLLTHLEKRLDRFAPELAELIAKEAENGNRTHQEELAGAPRR
jgi:prefoldin subunit 5